MQPRTSGVKSVSVMNVALNCGLVVDNIHHVNAVVSHKMQSVTSIDMLKLCRL
jgi:hypothetical protein